MAPTVTTAAGAVSGATERRGERNVDVFRGVPYAEPPSRFRPALKARPWAGTRSAVAFGPAAPQTPMAPVGLPAAAMDVGTDIDEAGCLTLNVWAPAGAKACPVLVWFHGGSFVTGSSSMAS